MIKTDAAVRHIIIRLFGIRDVCLLFQYFRNTFGTGSTHGHHNEDHG